MVTEVSKRTVRKAVYVSHIETEFERRHSRNHSVEKREVTLVGIFPHQGHSIPIGIVFQVLETIEKAGCPPGAGILPKVRRNGRMDHRAGGPDSVAKNNSFEESLLGVIRYPPIETSQIEAVKGKMHRFLVGSKQR